MIWEAVLSEGLVEEGLEAAWVDAQATEVALEETKGGCLQPLL